MAFPPSTFGNRNYLGSDFGYLRNQYRNLIDSGDPSVDLFREQGAKRIGMSRRRAEEDIRESQAQSGFKGTGANLFNDLFEQEALQLGEVNLQATQMEQASRERAMAQLMGLTQFEGSQAMGEDQFKEGIRQFDITTEEGRRQFEEQMRFKWKELGLREEEMGGGFWDIAGDVLGFGFGVATGGLGAGFGGWLSDELFGSRK